MNGLRLELEGKSLDNEEIRVFLFEYKKMMESNRNSRYFNLLSLVPKGKYGLDYGCGWGAFTKLVQEKGNRVVGQDINENETNICRFVWGQCGSIQFSNKKITEFGDSEFDFVLSTQVIEHTHNPGTYLHNINRVLRADGELIISLPNIITPRYLVNFLKKDMENKLKARNLVILDGYEKKRDHIQGWDPFHFVTFAASIGFELERFIPIEGVALPWYRKKLFNIINIPPYIYPSCRLRNFCYTMGFKFRKQFRSDIGVFD